MKQLEHNEQVALIKWWQMSCQLFGISEQLLFAIPNGGQRNIIVAKRMKDEGVRAGVPDLFLAYPTSKFSGLFIELKKEKGGRASDKQKTMLSMLSEVGYETAICHGWIEAKTTIENYLRA